MAQLRLTARYVFPVESPPLPGGVVAIENGRIVSVLEGGYNLTALAESVVAHMQALALEP